MKIIECPRDAMQGISEFIPTEQKIAYINQLLMVGFDTIDFGSFVSPKAIPQMKDTEEVLQGIDLSESSSRLLAIIANVRGAREAAVHDQISYLGFPLSVSETFQKRNTNKSIQEAFGIVEEIQTICAGQNKEMVVYLSMGFGNPYGDPYDKELLNSFSEKLANLGVKIISLADTIGTATVDQIKTIFSELPEIYPDVEFGAHLHSTPEQSADKIQAVIDSGCERIDAALLGFGGCPMAKDDLTGNIDTNVIVSKLKKDLALNMNEFRKAEQIARGIFSEYK